MVIEILTSEADILATGSDGGAADAITAAIFTVTKWIEQGIRQEAIISTCVVLIWVIIAVIGVFRALFFMLKGGDDGTWQANLSTERDQVFEKRLDANDLARVPTYEQATRQRSDTDATNDSANLYHGQAYTLSAKPYPPVPTLQAHNATSPIFNSGFSPHEKMGNVNGQIVDSAIRRPSHIRASSHGNYEITSPDNQYSTNNYQSTQNPFADPVR